MTTVDGAVGALLQAKQFEKSTGKKDENLSKELADTLLAKDALINEDLATYASNRRLTTPEDPMIEEIEGQIGFGKILEQKAEEEQKKGKESLGKRIKKLASQGMFFTKRNRAYLDNYEQEKLKFSLKAQRVIDTIERESGQKVKVVVDPEFTESFRFFMGISYRGGGMFGKYIVVSDPKTLEDEEFLRHEAIHCAQQRDLGFIRRLAISFTSLGLKFLKVKELDEAMDFGTDNQVTDYESYLNQFNKGYLKTRKPGDRKKYRNAEFRKQEMNRFKEEEIDTLIDKLEELEKDYLPAATTDVEKKEIELEIEKMKSDIDQYTHVYEELKKMDEVLVVMIKPDIQGNKKEDTREQVYFESKANREKRLPVEKFIQKYGKKEDNYKQGVEYYIEYKNLLDKFNETSTLGEKEKKDVAKRFLEYIKVKSPENMKKFFEDNKEFLDEHSIKESE